MVQKLNQGSIMKNLTLAILALSVVSNPVQASKTKYKDSDWNVTFMTNKSHNLHGQDIKWVDYNGDKALQFTLEGGKPGLRGEDDKQQSWGPKFKERNEVYNHEYFDRKPHTIELQFKMVAGFRTRHESFFQIHSYGKNCKSAKPPLMLRMHRGELRALTKGSDQNDQVPINLNVHRKQLIGKWHDLVITSKLIDKNHISYSIQSKSLGINKTLPNSYMLSCGTQYVKFGIYRPSKANIKFKQSLTKINATSVIQFDDIKLLKK
jgi:hypothetical protein